MSRFINQYTWSIIKKDPELEKPEHQPLKKIFEPYFEKKSEFFGVG